MSMQYGLPSGYGDGFGVPGGGGFAEIAERQRAMAPLAQYQAALAQMNPTAGRYAQQAAMQGFNPAYAMYEAFGIPGSGAETYGSFTDYLAAGNQQTQASLQDRMRMIADATTGGAATIDPVSAGLAEIYYGGDPGEAASRRLASAEMMSGLGAGRANPQMQRAMQSVIDRMYNQYLGSGTGTGGYASTAPGGFMDYYLRQRGLRNAPATA